LDKAPVPGKKNHEGGKKVEEKSKTCWEESHIREIITRVPRKGGGTKSRGDEAMGRKTNTSFRGEK